MTDKVLEELLKIISIKSLIIGVFGTMLLTTVINGFVVGKSAVKKYLTPKRVLVTIAAAMAFISYEYDAATTSWRMYVFNLITIWGLAVIIYDHLGGKWFVNFVTTPLKKLTAFGKE